MNTPHLLRTVASILACSLFAASAFASKFPEKSIRIIVPYAVGGANDQVTRVLAGHLQKDFGYPVIVENKPGAGGLIGAENATKAAADGYTLLLGETGAIAVSPNLMRVPPYDAARDLVALAAVSELPLIIAANSETNLKTLNDLKDLAKKGSIPYGSAGNGTVQHLSMEILSREMGLDMEHIAYRGGAPAMTDLIGGQIPIAAVSASTASPPASAGSIRPIAALGSHRGPPFPDLPTVAEQGYPNVQVSAWLGIFAPANTPKDVTETLSQAIRRALDREDTKKSLAVLNIDVLDMERSTFDAYVKADIERWKSIIAKYHFGNP